MSHRSDGLINLMTRQLAAFARLGALRHLDLNIIRVYKILDGDAKTSRGHLLYGRSFGVRGAIFQRQVTLA